MERVRTLCDKLNEQLLKQAPAGDLLVTVQLLHSELLHIQASQPGKNMQNQAAIHIAANFENLPAVPAAASEPKDRPATKPAAGPAREEKIIEVLQVDEAEVEAELEEIKRNAENLTKIGSHNKPPMLFDPVEDTPTLTQQHATELPKKATAAPPKKAATEIHETIAPESTDSLNERLKESKTELTDSLKDAPIKDLKKGIGVNDRFLFIRELFKGDDVMYERSIKTINGFAIYPEAEYWIKRELKLKLAWDDRNEVVKQFDQLIRRRFS